MFDVSFTELLVIAVVALVVIGPERLPRVARTVGHLMGRAQRYVTDVKREIRQELDAADQATGGLMALRKEMQESKQALEHSLSDVTHSLRQPLADVQEAVNETTQEIAQLGQEITTSAGQISQDITQELAPDPETGAQEAAPVALPEAKP